MKCGELEVRQFETRAQMGAAAAADIRDRILQLLQEKESINMIFAAAPSQNEVLFALAKIILIVSLFSRRERMHFFMSAAAASPISFLVS